MSVPPHDNCPGVPSIERLLGHIRTNATEGSRKLMYEHALEIRDMDIKDALEYLMLEHMGIATILATIAKNLGIDSLEKVLEGEFEKMDKELN